MNNPIKMKEFYAPSTVSLQTAITMTRFHVSREELWKYFEYFCLGCIWIFFQISRCILPFTISLLTLECYR